MPAESSQYLSIVFFGSQIVAALWQELNAKVTIIARSSLKKVADHDSLAEAVDLSLEELGEESLQVRQVLFVVPQAWTDQGQILDEHKDQLKTLSQDLLLDPLGFVVVEDGLQTWQEQTNGETFSGAIVHHHQDALQVRVSIDSEIAAIFQIGKSGQVRDDITELQARLKPYLEQLDRILFFDTSGQENDYNHLLVLLRQQLGKTVEKLTPQQVADIVITSGGQEMLGSTPATSEAGVTPPAPVESANTPADFHPPSFVVNQPATMTATASEPTTALPDDQEESFSASYSNIEPVLQSPPRKKKRRWQLPTFVFTPRRSRRMLLGGAIGVAILVLLLGSYFFLRSTYRVQVEVAVVNQKLETTTTLPLLLSSATSSAQLDGVPAEELSEVITVTKEVPTTGTKLTGDKATGKVIIYNKTSETKTFAKGTKLHANNKTFSLDNDVTVASASAEETRSSRTEKFGEAEAAITAESFGPEYNLAEKQNFTVEDFGTSSYSAVNDQALSGGTSREIQSVAQKDIATAIDDLTQEATTTLKDHLQARGSSDQPVLLTDTVDVQSTNSSLAVGEEAKLVTVSLTAEGRAYQLQLADLSQVAETVFGDQLEENYVFSPENLSFKNERLVVDGAQPELELDLKAQATPKIEVEEAKSLIQGEYTSRTTSILGRLPGVKQVKTELRPGWLRYFFRRVPTDPQRITVEIRPES